MKKQILIAAISAGLALPALAVPNTFTAGDAIVAAEMNENFTALENRIAVLEARLGINATFSEMIGGNTYSGQFIYFGYFGDDDFDTGSMVNNSGDGFTSPYAVRFLKGGGQVTMTFESDGTITNDMGQESESEGLLVGACTDYQAETCPSYSNDMQTYSDSWNEAAPSSTWSVDDSTGIVTIVFDGDPDDTEQFKVSGDGSVIYSLSYFNENDGMREVENSVVILTRD
ncbi:hypothetical protein [Vibrio ulleungensis]|uniref:Uncharacterized protein n=1 Tax=Vibrio ulleungensis TaxID=2807619 RepID=A0ABS2HLP0_9VIBR|nr:hypothetical protein [Vibrio ulleungensis]MBM7037929.1 hypothetical protein [Vibrio ulleungensis]